MSCVVELNSAFVYVCSRLPGMLRCLPHSPGQDGHAALPLDWTHINSKVVERLHRLLSPLCTNHADSQSRAKSFVRNHYFLIATLWCLKCTQHCSNSFTNTDYIKCDRVQKRGLFSIYGHDGSFLWLALDNINGIQNNDKHQFLFLILMQ